MQKPYPGELIGIFLNVIICLSTLGMNWTLMGYDHFIGKVVKPFCHPGLVPLVNSNV